MKTNIRSIDCNAYAEINVSSCVFSVLEDIRRFFKQRDTCYDLNYTMPISQRAFKLSGNISIIMAIVILNVMSYNKSYVAQQRLQSAQKALMSLA